MNLYALFLRGGSIREAREGIVIVPYGRFSGIFSSKEEAHLKGKRYVSSFSGGYRNYYRPRFSTVDLNEHRGVANQLRVKGVEV